MDNTDSSLRPQSILLVRLSALGDCLHAVPFVEALRAQRPDLEIGWLIQRGGLALLSDHPAVDRFHVFERGAKGLAGVRAMLRLRRELLAERYDIAVDLQGLTKSGFLARLSGAGRVVGFEAPDSRELNSWFVRERIGVEARVEHVVDRNLALLPSIGFEVPETATWNLPAVDLGGAQIQQQLIDLSDKPLAVLNPGTTWPTKIWGQRRFADVAQTLLGRGMNVVVSWGGDAEETLADRIVALCAELGGPVIKAAPTNLLELRGLFQRASLVVANDSGPLHLAVAVGVPAVGVYGPTDPARNGPYGWRDPQWPTAAMTLADLKQRSITSPGEDVADETVGDGRRLSCQYCWKTVCRRGDGACLTELDADVVSDRALSLLAKA